MEKEEQRTSEKKTENITREKEENWIEGKASGCDLREEVSPFASLPQHCAFL